MNKNLRRGMSRFLSVAFAMSLVLGGASKVKADDNSLNLDDVQIQKIKEQLYEIAENENKYKKIESEYKDQEEVVRVVVQLIGKPAAETTSEGVKATPEAISAVKAAQGSIKAQASVLDGAKIRHSYGNVVNGFSMDVKRKEIDRLKQLPGVKSVKEANIYEADMNHAKNLTQAFEAWNKYNLKGEGMLVSIIDTGIDFNHKDMKAPSDLSKLKLTKAKVDEKIKAGTLKVNDKVKGYYTDKIPFGFNYADENNEIIDTRPGGGHGIHVAGIVAADGAQSEVDNGQAVKGVAPEAQLLAMKVFSNGDKGEGAFEDDIVKAIEDSVTLEADIINMSLGSTAGFQDDEDAEQKAIKNATDKGITVVVSAGNSSYANAPLRDKTMKDISTVGTPALAKDALMVANYQNAKVTSYAASFLDDKSTELAKTPYTDHMFKFEENKNFEMVNCGVGKTEDFNGKDIKGKVALVIRGDLSFVDKIKNAQTAGAAGVVIYNYASGGDAMVSMATDKAITIPAIFIGYSDGKLVADKLAKKEVVKLNLTGSTITKDNQEADDYDDSTSWGAAPNLDFKPQIAGPGGNIFSTVNNNKYENMSGTSMAAPHVSGGMALILEAIKGYNKTLQGRDLVNYAKNIAMNTSQVRMDKFNKDVPFSPRRQGSGLIQIADAIRNKVTATYNGTAAVALKEIKSNKVEFVIDLNNYGNKDATYALENFKGVLTQVDEDDVKKMPHDVVLDQNKANVSFETTEVTVKAGSSAKVKVTLNIANELEKQRFLEGYIKFNSKNTENPSLVVPFMGYYGDWAEEKIVNYGAWENAQTVMATVDEGGLLSRAVTFDSKKMIKLPSLDKDGVKDNLIAISPNGDNDYDEIVPYLYMLRNAKRMTAEVIDNKGNVVKTLGEEKDVRRQVYSAKNNEGKSPKLVKTLKWDGKIGDKAAEEGQYTLVVKSYVDLPDAKAQEFNIPVKVDLTGPTFQIVSSNKSEGNNYKVQWKQSDNLSGVNVSSVFLNGELLKDADIKHDKTTDIYSTDITLVEGKINEIVVAGLDNVKNFGASKIKVDKVAPMVQVSGVENNKVYNTSVTPVINVDDKDATVTTTLNGKTYDGKEITKDGKYELVVTVTDKAGNNTEFKVSFAIDKTAPEVTVKGVENGKIYDKEVTPEITLDDKDATLKITLNGKEYDGKTAIKEEGKYKLEIVATDKVGNAKETTIEFEIKLPSEDKNEEKPVDNQKPGNDNGTANTTTTNNEISDNTNINTKVNTNETKTTTDKLAKTGSVVNGNLLMSLGASLMGIGAAVFSSKKRKEK